jgi:multidrug transporter EmrE-like cation transporter
MNLITSTILNSLFLAALLTLSHGLLKWVSLQKSDTHLGLMIEYWWVFGSAIGVYGFIFFYYAYILKSTSINLLYPTYTGLSIISVFLMGVLIFNEPVTAKQIIGCIFIFIGIYFVIGIDF